MANKKTDNKTQSGKNSAQPVKKGYAPESKERKRLFPGLSKATLLDPDREYNKASIIVLVVCGVIFLGLAVWLNAQDILEGKADMFNVYGDEMVEFHPGKVLDIPSEDMKQDDDAEGSWTGTQELTVKVATGNYKGQTMTAYNYFGPLYGVPVAKGDSVMLTIKTHNDGTHSATVYEFNRIPILAVFVVLFFALVIIVGGRTGLKSLIGLVITMICLFAVLIPLLLKGAPTIITTFLVCAFVAVVSFTILGGIHRKTISAFLGTIAGVFLAMLFALGIQAIAKINGYRMEDAEPLLQLRYVGAVVRIKGLLVAGIIISALGAVMDVAMSISSALEEIHAANPALKRNELFRSGMNIGRDMVGTMTNTLILAFLGSQFTLMIFMFARSMTFNHLTSTAFIALETISGISASIGMVLAIPLTALIASTMIAGKKA